MQLKIDGYPVYIATSGSPEHVRIPRIVLVHGAQNDHRVWTEQLAWFAAQGYAVFAPDLPGHGQSTGPVLASVELMGQWLGKLLNVILPPAVGESPSVIFVGHSMGSLAAMECAAYQPERTAALVLAGTAFPMKVSPVLLEQARTNEATAITQIAQWSYAPDLPGASQVEKDLRRVRLAGAEQLMLSQMSGVLYSDLRACNSYQRGLEAAKMISCPSLIVAGSKDQMTPPKFAMGLQQELGADFQTIDGVGHSMMSEQGKAFCETIQKFLSKLDFLQTGPMKK